MFFSKITNKFIALVLVISFAIPGVALPIGLNGIQKVEAIPTTEVGPLVAIEAGQLKINGLKLVFANTQNFKEFVLDPLVWALINTIITNMLQELTRWVNSGFQGEPAFITDLEGFLLDALDEVAGEFLSDQGLEFLCSPFRLDVKIALNLTYQQARNETTANECRLTDMSGNIENFLQGTFSEGGWESWFDLTIDPTNDPNKAFLENRARLRIRLLDEYGREITEAAAKDFFLDVKVCQGKGLVIETKNKKAPKDCIVTTPGRVVEAQVNDALGLPRQRLAFADEFDELIGALLAQLANQVLMGVNGLLGLGGSSYSDSNYGADTNGDGRGNQTYLEALRTEASQQIGGGGDGIEHIINAINNERDYINLMQETIAMVDSIESELDDAKAEFQSCFSIRMTPDLTDARDKARVGIITANNNISILEALYRDYLNATSPEDQTNVIEQFYSIQGDVIAATETEIIQAEINIDYILPDEVSGLRAQITDAVTSCIAAESR